ncbi:unnamed protein product [Haemonchus placei]|uniref:CDGSH iron-sulfur domain-containing protein 2 homologue n=1 Tax=Haemonchus placei TaxID=6290 RepID=A0A158QL71_HAEPC|nr:unnamed protein product [Haemonchus placei]
MRPNTFYMQLVSFWVELLLDISQQKTRLYATVESDVMVITSPLHFQFVYKLGYKLALRRARVNAKVQLANDKLGLCIEIFVFKVVDTVDVEDIGEKKAFCRCWRSEKFPYCDGAHTKHNKETGDNVGPLVVKGKH